MTFVLLTSAMVFMMFVLGWIAGAIHQRLKRGSSADSKAIDRLTTELAVAESARDECHAELAAQKQEMTSRLAERDELYHETIDRLRDAEMRLNQLNGNS